MREIYLKTPELSELAYRKNLLADKETMAYNNKFGGTINFEKEKWESWFNKWIGNKDEKYFYAYIYDKEDNKPVGEVGYRFDEETNSVILNIIVEASQRGKGYGYSGLSALIKEAFDNGYDELRDLVYIDSNNSHALFEKLGFKCVGIVNDSKDYRLTKKDYQR
jgi:diamine N-acetyltransferase